MPFANDLTKKIDFNDLLIKDDRDAVNNCVGKAIDIGEILRFNSKSSSLSQDFIKIQNQKFNAKEFISSSKEKEIEDQPCL